jgi:arylsulfatase A-like enzyme
MIDTVRTDCLSCYGDTEFATPVIDAFAARGALFEQAITPEPLTRPAVCTLLTGYHPRTHGVDSNTKSLGDDFTTVAEVLRARGYRTAAFTAASVLSGDFGTAQGFDYYSEPSEPWWYLRSDCAVRRLYVSLTSWADWWVEIPADVVTDRAIDWLEANGERPFFAFIHYFDPHAPYAPPEEYDLAVRDGLGHIPPPYEDEHARFAPGFEMPPDYLRQEWLRYRGEISYVDAELGRLLRYLDASGASARCYVAVSGDHGESFEHQAWFSHGTRLYEQQIHVPLMFAGPGIPEGRRVETQVRLIDVFPTLLSLVGEAIPGNVQGVDLCRAMDVSSRSGGVSTNSTTWSGDDDLPAFSQTDLEDRRPFSSRVSYSLRQPPWKLIDSPELGLKELYDLTDDTEETRNLADMEPDVLSRLAEALREWQAATPKREVEAEEMSPEVEESLRALGYVQ